MKTTTPNALQIINGEPDMQKRIKLLVDQGFRAEASQTIRELARAHTAMFQFDCNHRDFSRPLPRVTGGPYAVYVIITTSNRLDYHPGFKEKEDQHIIFELGWERQALGWTEEESLLFFSPILAHALALPLDQWSFRQAEGTGRAARRLLHASDPMAREIAALHLVYHLREANFRQTHSYLGDIKGFPFADNGVSKPPDANELVEWIIEQLLKLGWTHYQIRKELAEWILSKTKTPPQWLLPVAQASVFEKHDPTRASAVRHWVRHRFDSLPNTVPGQQAEAGGMAEVYRQLFRLGQFEAADEPWILDRLVRWMASGKVQSVTWFLAEFSEILGFGKLDQIRNRAIAYAQATGKHGIAVALIEDGGGTPDPELTDIVKVRGLTTKLK